MQRRTQKSTQRRRDERGEQGEVESTSTEASESVRECLWACRRFPVAGVFC